MATRAALGSFADVMGGESTHTGKPLTDDVRISRYDYWWMWYKNAFFFEDKVWPALIAEHKLYKWTRPIYNPTRRLVDFYVGNIFSGPLTSSGKAPDGQRLGIPLAKDTKDELRQAFGQLWQWWNWEENMRVWIRYGAALGDAPVIPQFNKARGRVEAVICWPGDFTEVELDHAGNLQGYKQEFISEWEGRSAKFTKVANKESFTTYKDDELFDWTGEGRAERENEYGFVPGVWLRHTNTGGTYGDPALRCQEKVIELNELISNAHDALHRRFSAPGVLSGTPSPDTMTAGGDPSRWQVNNPVRLASTSATKPRRRGELELIRVQDGVGISALNLPGAELVSRVEAHQDAIEAEHPELSVPDALVRMAQATGPAARLLLAPAERYFQPAARAYAVQVIKLMQQSTAIQGHHTPRANGNNQWAPFVRYNLDSYRAGDLDCDLEDQTLVPDIGPTNEEIELWSRRLVDGQITFKTWCERVGVDYKQEMARFQEEGGAPPLNVRAAGATDEDIAAVIQGL